MMKTHPQILRPQFAFTLIELITVMAIIAILMGILLPVIAAVRETARRNQASTVTKAIVNGCKNYTTDYGKFPAIEGALVSNSDGSYYSYGDTRNGKCRVTNDQLFDVLRAIAREPNEGNKLNRRQQSYFEDKKATDRSHPREGFADGKDFPEEIQGQLLDPWGTQYCVVLNADGGESLKLSEFFKDQAEPIRQTVAAFSMAKDGDIGGKGYQGRLQKENSSEAPNDITSWQ